MSTDTLQAGPELDAEISRRVFKINVIGITRCREWEDRGGWCVDAEGNTERPVYASTRYQPVDPQYACGCLEIEARQGAWFRQWCAQIDMEPPPDEPLVFGHVWTCLSIVPEYSTRIEDAWSVVEHLCRDGSYVFQASGPIASHYPGYRFGFWRGGLSVHRDNRTVEAETLPLAICRAALLVLECEVPR